MRSFIAKFIGYPLQDYYKKTKIMDTLKILRESQSWDEGKIRDYQSAKLRLLLNHSYKNVPYYEKLFRGLKLKPSDVKSIEDIYKIPLLTKEIVRKENMNLIARGFNMQKVKQGRTGGTTGAPVIIFKDTINRSFTWASYYRWYEWMGFNHFDSVVTFWGAQSVFGKSLKRKILSNSTLFIQNELKIDSFTMNEKDNMHKIYQRIFAFNPTIIKGYLSSLIDFAIFLKKHNFQLKPKAIASPSETLLPHHRIFLENIFKVPVYNQYGCGEVSAISYECSHHNGLHINMEHVICEILNNNKKNIIDATGRVIGTDLDNFVMPFIRFDTEDLSSISHKKCGCGVNQPLMKSIDGRDIDTIILKNGNRVHGVFFTKILSELGLLSYQIQKFQILQNIPGEIEFKIQCEDPLQESYRENLISSLKKFLNKVNYSEHKILASENNGKFRYIKSTLL